MREEIECQEKPKTGAGRKTLIVFGILFLAIGVFLVSFTCSFQVMIASSQRVEEDGNSLESENAKLKEEVQILSEQVEILETELEKYKGTQKMPTFSSPESPSSGTTTTEKSSVSDSDSSADTTAKPTKKPTTDSATASSTSGNTSSTPTITE